jgi:hypothetical protein
MSIPDRIGRLGKAYVGAIKEKIESELSEREAAVDELDGGASSRRGKAVPPPPASELSDLDSLMRRAEEKIAAARQGLEAREELSPGGRTPAPPVSVPDATPLAADYRVLGLAVGASLSEVQASYDDLTRRSDPKRFPEGSSEQAQARRILERVNLAYDNIRRENNPTEDRFAKLEL